ncbi:hypothetical protein HPB48_014512 [Haemaphysalis longicornis]|uniref:Uncharacterized protein n=1 Tax=Haemaphysalis longicornis TaxID=44386 RepID=A0A9J6GIN0_HAELO|nr:hypothetical protein HPB48_014512 [Haemaphysalis longicornis]
MESAMETCAPLSGGDDAGCSDEVGLENPPDDAAEAMPHLDQVGSARQKMACTPTERPRCAISLDSVRSGSERTHSNEDGGYKRERTCRENNADSERAWNPTSQECVAPKVPEGITASSEVHNAPEVEIDYTKFEYLTPTLSQPKYAHILEMYDFPAEFETEDLESALSSSEHQFTIKRVDDTHALAVFSTPLAATQALGLRTPLVKMRRISEACTQSRVKVRRYGEFLTPFKSRPETSAAVAVRLLSGSLGVRAQVDPERQQRELRGAKGKGKSEGKRFAGSASYGDVP